jgi:hypothetical protein
MTIACDLSAIDPADRSRHRELAQLLRVAIRARREHADGFTFTLDSRAIALEQIAQWIDKERLCCPFLQFDLCVSGAQTGWSLTLSGPEGTKAILQAEF